LAFSIPSNLVKQVADQLREFGRVKRGWIGVSYQSVTDDIADSFGLDRARGVLVANVMADGPAAQAGLKRNDIILSFTAQDVTDIVTKLQQQKKRSVLLFVERQGDPRFAALRLTK